MNKEEVQAAMDDLKAKQDLFLISKLEEEYNELSDKCNKLYKFIYSLDFKEKVPDSNEQCLLQEQHKRMEAYRTNLYQRIEHYRIKVKIALGCDYFASWGDVAEKIHQKHHCGQDTRRRDEAAAKLCDLLVKGRMAVYAPGKKCAKCGGDLFEGFGTVEGEKILCFNCTSQITNDELQQALDEYRAACLHHCGQDATCQVDDGIAVVDKPIITGESLEQLVGSTVRLFHKPGHKCEGCPYEVKSYGGKCEYKKVELVGGYYLCLAPQPGSIITE